MNGNYYQNPTFPNSYSPINEDILNEQNNIPITANNNANIFKINKGKRVNVYVTFPNSKDTTGKIFNGIIENIYDDYLIISDPETSKWYLLNIKYIDYIEFMEKIEL